MEVWVRGRQWFLRAEDGDEEPRVLKEETARELRCGDVVDERAERDGRSVEILNIQ